MGKFLIFVVLCIIATFKINAQSAKSDSLFAIGVDLYNAGKYQEAIPVFEACDKLDKAELDSTSNRRDYSAKWLASCYCHLGDSVKANYIHKDFRFTPVDRRLTVKSDSLADIGIKYLNKGEWEKALPYFIQCTETEKNVLGEEHITYGFSLFNCAGIYLALNDSANALKYSKKAAVIFIKHHAAEYTSLLLITIGYLYSNYLKDNINALYYIKENAKIAKLEYGSKSYEYAKALNELSNFYANKIEKHEEAINCLKESIGIVGTGHSLYFTLLFNLAYNYMAIGNYVESIRILNENLQLCEKQYGKYSATYINSLKNMSECYYRIGEYSEGIRCGIEALDLFRQIEEKDKYGLLQTSIQNHLALNYQGIGDYYKAIQIVEDNLKYIKTAMDEVVGNNSGFSLEDNYCIDLINLVGLYSIAGKYKQALELESEALEACSHHFGKEHSKYANLLNNLAISYNGVGNHEKAIQLVKEDLAITEKRLGRMHPDYAQSLSNLASYYREANNYEEAIHVMEEAIQIIKATLGKKHHKYSSYSLDLAKYYYAIRNVKQLSHYVLESTKSRESYLLKNFLGLTSREKSSIWEDGNEVFYGSHIHTAAYINRSDSMIINAYNGTLLGKGILLNSEIEMNNLLIESGSNEVIETYRAYQKNRQMLEKLYEKPIAERTLNTDSLEKSVDKLERQLLKMSKIFGDYTQNLRIKWENVQTKLGQKDVSVEFVSFPYTNDSTMYVAYVLKKDITSPNIVPLFEEKQLKKEEGLYKNTSVSKLVWEPLAKYLEGVQNVYFAPAGELYNIGIEYLPHWSGEGRMSEKWNMYRLSSTRQLAVIKDKHALKQASVYGGVKYETKEDLLVADSRKYRSQERSFNYEPFAIADSLNLRAGASYLPATKTEAEEIDKTLEQKKIMTKLLIDSLATEGAFKDLSGKKTNLLHIATHGFYWTETEAKYKDNLNFLMLNDNNQRYIEDKALTRSGLLLAGANNALMGKKLPEGVDDGILTAKEISQLDLRGLDLVVLSACETGLGEIKGDGVFGLQRGFKKAGANSLLMSLWKVDDNATQLLMTQFYKNLTSGMSKFESLRQAQKYVRDYEVEVEVKSDIRPSVSAHAKEQAQQNANKEKTIKKMKKYEDPKYWAAFILLDAID